MRTIHGLMIGAILCAAVLTGCREKTATAEQAPVSVKVKAVEMNSVSNGVRYSANIIPNSQVEMAFKVGGYVERVLQMRGVDGRMRDVQAGDLVTKGTVLARVRQSDYVVKVNQAEAQSLAGQTGIHAGRHDFGQSGVRRPRPNREQIEVGQRIDRHD